MSASPRRDMAELAWPEEERRINQWCEETEKKRKATWRSEDGSDGVALITSTPFLLLQAKPLAIATKDAAKLDRRPGFQTHRGEGDGKGTVRGREMLGRCRF